MRNSKKNCVEERDGRKKNAEERMNVIISIYDARERMLEKNQMEIYCVVKYTIMHRQT